MSGFPGLSRSKGWMSGFPATGLTRNPLKRVDVWLPGWMSGFPGFPGFPASSSTSIFDPFFAVVGFFAEQERAADAAGDAVAEWLRSGHSG